MTSTKHAITGMAAFAALGFAAVSAASAAEPGPYVGLKGGAVSVEDMVFSDPTTADMTIDSKTGWLLGGVAGYRFANVPLRGELELAYQRNNIGGTYSENVLPIVACGNDPGNPCLSGRIDDGRLGATTFFGMGYFDIPAQGRLTPYVGVGLGMVHTSLEAESDGSFNNGSRTEVTLIDDGDTVLGYRAAAGFAYALSSNVDLTLDYTYTRTDRPSLAGSSPVLSFDFDRRMNAHAVNAGVRLAF